MLSSVSVTNVRRHLYLYGDVGFPDDIEEEVSKWDSEWNYPNEHVIMHINSTGGSVDGLSTLMHRLEKVGSLYAIVEGSCMSAALILYLLAEFRAAVDNSLFMAHNAVLYNTARTSETQVNNLKGYTDSVAKSSKRMLETSLYKPKYISKRELEDIVKGNELYMDYESALERGIINTGINLIPSR